MQSSAQSPDTPLDDRPHDAFVLDAIPPGLARVLEVGAGRGVLAATLRRAGHDVIAIDRFATPGTRVQPQALEAHRARRYDAVVAVRVLHHVEPLEPGVERLAALVRPSGRLIVSEFAPDRLDDDTAAWLLERWRRAGTDNRGRPPPETVEALQQEWQAQLGDLHGHRTLVPALRERFLEVASSWAPCLCAEYFDGVGARDERQAIASGAIRALGYRWVGTPA